MFQSCACYRTHERGKTVWESSAQFHRLQGLFDLTLSVPSNSEWVVSSGPSNIGAKRNKVGVAQEKPDKNAHISTVNIAVLPLLSDTIIHSSSRFIQNQAAIHCSSHQLYARCRHPCKVSIQCFRKLIFLWLATVFSLIRRQCNAIGSDRLLSLHRKEVRFETGFILAVFSETTKVEFAERGSRSSVRNLGALSQAAPGILSTEIGHRKGHSQQFSRRFKIFFFFNRRLLFSVRRHACSF